MEESDIKTKNILMTAIALQWRHVPNSTDHREENSHPPEMS